MENQDGEFMLVTVPVKLPSAFTVTVHTPTHVMGQSWQQQALDALEKAEDAAVREFMGPPSWENAVEPPRAHCSPAVLLESSKDDAATIRALQWQSMLDSIPSAPKSDHGCRLANYLARQEQRRNVTMASSLRNKEGPTSE